MTLPPFSRQMMLLLAGIGLSGAVFGLWPGLDLWVTGLFHDNAGGFGAADSGLPNALRLAIWRVSEALVIVALAALGYGVWRRADAFGLPRRLWGYVIGLYLIGPGLMVDGLLKPVWGRARPANVEEFGGKLAFSPPYRFSDECARNCSFVSGEVSGAVALAVALLLILGQLRAGMDKATYRLAVAVVVALPVFTAWQRIAAGRHFLSDAIFAALLTLLVAAILYAALAQKGWVAAVTGRR